MRFTEEVLNKLCRQLTSKHFAGLRVRPVIIDDSIKPFAIADEPNMIFNSRIHPSMAEARRTIIHELIHYELKDSGKYSGHGQAFLKRAKQLGIFGIVELSQCSIGEEIYHMPRRTEIVEIPIEAVEKRFKTSIANLKTLAGRAPMKIRQRIFTEALQIEAAWFCYHQAVANGEKVVREERIRLRPGPKGKPLDELLDEEKKLNSQLHQLFKKYEESKDATTLRAVKKANRMLSRLTDRIERDYQC